MKSPHEKDPFRLYTGGLKVKRAYAFFFDIVLECLCSCLTKNACRILTKPYFPAELKYETVNFQKEIQFHQENKTSNEMLLLFVLITLLLVAIIQHTDMSTFKSIPAHQKGTLLVIN